MAWFHIPYLVTHEKNKYSWLAILVGIVISFVLFVDLHLFG